MSIVVMLLKICPYGLKAEALPKILSTQILILIPTINVNVEYYSTASDTQTQNQIAVANITLTNLDPIVGRVHSVNTLLKSQGLTSAEFQLISNNRVEPTSSVSFKVPIPTEQLNDPKTLKLQF